jgi:nucleotide-binding universal stress UspA family protein
MHTNRVQNLPSPVSLGLPRATSTLRLFDGPSDHQQAALLGDHRAADDRIKSILVPLDGSVFAEHAIPLALGIAEQCGAVLHLVHVVAAAEMIDPYDALGFADASLSALKRDKHRYLSDLVQRVSATPSMFIASRLIDGRTVSSSLEGLPGLDADLIVMATHGRGAFGRFWFGSVAHSLLQRISVPMILVRGNNEPVDLKATAIDHVLLSVDGTKNSEKVIKPVLELGLFPTARHTLLHVVRLDPKYVIRGYALRTEWVPSRRRWIAGMQYLHSFARTLRDNGRSVYTKVVSSDEPKFQVVLRSADQLDAGLIGVAYHRQLPIMRLVWPSYAEYLFRNSNRPLMLVPVESSS